ncbi:MFS transporter [Salinibacterium sp. M195]|uniref:MFS transporter n=1 Tax=Salinibacterium sp. M195 TaxID=2583374 RepID=UPI001C6374D3|nr:MFS transporter [Salinibacterium sp. M195]QYH34813.1 MFS transporter [Salinibacterium sp. M195]
MTASDSAASVSPLPHGLTTRQVLSWRNAIATLFALAGFSFASWVGRIPTVRDTFDATHSEIGVLLFGLAIGSLLGLLVAGKLVDRFGARIVVRVCVVVFVGSLAATALIIGVLGSFLGAVISLAVFGLAFSTYDVAINLSGTANERLLGRSTMPTLHGFYSLGTMGGAGFGAAAEALHVPLATHLIIVSAIVLITALLVSAFILPERLADPPPNTVEMKIAAGELAAPKLKSVWLEPRTILIGIIVLGMAFAEGSAIDWLALAMVDGYEISNAFGTLIFGVFVTAMTATRFYGVRALDRFGRVPVLRTSAGLAAIGLLLVIFSPVVLLAVIGTALWGAGAALGFPVGISAAADDPKRATARVTAVATIAYASTLIGPPMIGVLSDQVGVLHALLLIVVLAIISGLLSPYARELAGRHAYTYIDFSSPGTTSAAVTIATTEMHFIITPEEIEEAQRENERRGLGKFKRKLGGGK